MNKFFSLVLPKSPNEVPGAGSRDEVNDVSYLIDNLQDAFLSVDGKWRIQFVNRKAEGRLQKSREEVAGKVLWDISPEAKDSIVGKKLLQIMHSRIAATFEEFYPPSGSWLELRVFPFGSGIAISWRDISEAKQLALHLQKNEKQLRVIVNALPALIAYVDSERRYQFANANYERWFGLPTPEILGRSLEEMLGSEFYETARPYLDRAYAGEAIKFESEIRLPTGPRLLTIDYIPDVDLQNRVKGLFILAVDMTAQRRSEERLLLAERGSKIGIWHWNVVTDEVEVSCEWKKMIGLRPEIAKIDNQEWESRLHPLDKAHTLETLQEFLKGQGNTYETEYRLRHENGEYRWILAQGYLTRDALGKPLKMSGTQIDITQQKLAAEHLKTLAQYERLLLKISSRLLHLSAQDVGLGITEALNEIGLECGADRAHVYLLSENCQQVSLTYCWLKGQASSPKGSDTHSSIEDFPHMLADFRARRMFRFQNTTDISPDDFALQEFVTFKNCTSGLGVPMFFRENLLGFITVGGLSRSNSWSDEILNFMRMVAEIFVSAIQRSNTERALLEQTEILARSNADLEQFAYISSHDLQEPLRTMSIYMELIDRRYRNHIDDEGRKFLEIAVASAQQMRELIHDILTYSRSSRRELVGELVDLDAVVTIALKNLQKSINESKAIITCDSLPEVWGDRFQFVQLFQNLLSNAIKYRGSDTPRIQITSRLEGNQWCFSVTDNGIGIEERYFERIFQIFERLHIREKYSGTGIGLALAKKIVERHGGKIWIESVLGKGSTFHFSLQRRSL